MGGSVSVAGAENWARTREVSLGSAEVRKLLSRAAVEVQLISAKLEEHDEAAVLAWNQYLEKAKEFASDSPRLRVELVHYVEAENTAYKTAKMRETLQRYIQRTERALMQSGVDDIVLSASDPLARLHANADPAAVLDEMQALMEREAQQDAKTNGVLGEMDARTKSEMQLDALQNNDADAEEHMRRLETFARQVIAKDVGLAVNGMQHAGIRRPPTKDELKARELHETL
jgi:hypothetical protein